MVNFRSETKKPLFWASQGSDPSEELNWEANRQKILERHNSPRKGTAGDTESDTTEVVKNLLFSFIYSFLFRVKIPSAIRHLLKIVPSRSQAIKNPTTVPPSSAR